MALALKGVDWQAIREAYVLGLTSMEISERFGVSDSLIRVRAARGKWSSPARVRALRAARLASAPGGESSQPLGAAGVPVDSDASLALGVPPVSQHVADGSKGSEIATEMASESLERLAEGGSLVGARLLHGLLLRAARDPEALKSLQDAGDVVTAVKGLRSSAGLDKSESAVQVNVALFGGSGSGSGGYEV